MFNLVNKYDVKVISITPLKATILIYSENSELFLDSLLLIIFDLKNHSNKTI